MSHMAGLSAALLVLAACVLSGRVSAYYDQATPSLEKVNGMSASDSETSPYLIPRLAHKYRPDSGDWFDVNDPALYLLTEAETEEALLGSRRAKRTGLGGGPSLSIVNPLDVLRQRLLLEIARRRMSQSKEKINANRERLNSIGKRSAQFVSDNDVTESNAMSRLFGYGDYHNALSSSSQNYNQQPRWASQSS